MPLTKEGVREISAETMEAQANMFREFDVAEHLQQAAHMRRIALHDKADFAFLEVRNFLKIMLNSLGGP